MKGRQVRLVCSIFFLMGVAILFQNCGSSDVTRSVPLSSEGPATDAFDSAPEQPLPPSLPPVDDAPLVVPAVTVFAFEAADMTLSDGMALAGNGFSMAAANTDPATSGLAQVDFTVEVAGEYVVDANVLALSISSNSFFVNIDSNPVAVMVWHILPAPVVTSRRVSHGGVADVVNPEHRFLLEAGEHTLFIRGRETDVILESLTIMKVDL